MGRISSLELAELIMIIGTEIIVHQTWTFMLINVQFHFCF